jgi:hypothetical protein
LGFGFWVLEFGLREEKLSASRSGFEVKGLGFGALDTDSGFKD